ncbi:NAD(+)--dinitrogen-reductase ADP-D-ribosyltransferase [Geobacter sp.]|uniref:NAD(+)--dinitrogen-reductase ADP-D-ribosyltransferase n=1 Tax=Geobacter sp. TaxID=46610 RepID=UPI001AD51BAE|nr:NAD(+)--dinitrogen-reductase ADP-D-ribosyltransferase [Geobacter sp.]CAG0932212.1 NAD(+)--dinitrogen-reductase ADP-D-ribosyltransferase [Rhodocyclaceae bacterium]
MNNSGFNLCNLPPWVIASRHFNDNPHPLEVQGVRLANRFLFDRLDVIASPDERGTVFNDYMSVKFQLHHWQEQQTAAARKSLRNSYLRYLRGWMMDSNSVEGAVLKGWVESRMGIVPTFHKVRIGGTQTEAYYTYMVDRNAGSKRTSAINSQLDILHEFCQYELARRFPGERWVTLYRGTFGADDYDVVEELGKREKIIRFNNLVSFTSIEERAWEFGSTVWEIRAPLAKVFFFDDLLPNSILKGEGEYLVIGGEYRVRRVMCTV